MQKQPIRDFVCPRDCLSGVGEVWSGQYAFKANVNGPVRVLDIGANVGAFSLWARSFWPECTVTAYEPVPGLFWYLKKNAAGQPVKCINAAVGDPVMCKMFPGKETRLCCSQYQGERQGDGFFKVNVVMPESLPAAEIVKIDAEGAEGYIVERMQFVPALMVVEWHGEENRRRVENALKGKMALMGGTINDQDWGHYKYASLKVLQKNR
jgi:FkbM family methyltransferase